MIGDMVHDYRLTDALRRAAEAGDRDAQRRIRVAAELGDLAAIRYLEAPFRWHVESPIERMLVIAIDDLALSRKVPEAYEDQRDFVVELNEGIYYRVETQAPIGPYRADVLLTSRRDETVRIVVECDGREWHTSPEQVARDRKRDRYMEDLGYLVVRFTGHDIYCQTRQCAEELIRIATASVEER